MDLAELKCFVEETRKECPVIWVPGSQVRAGGGQIEWTTVQPFGEHTSGGYRFAIVIFLDEERPVDELLAVWFHELGHFIYAHHTAGANYDDFDSELAAMSNELRELLKRQLFASLKISLTNYELILGAGPERFPRHRPAIIALSETPLWRDAKARLLHEMATNGGGLSVQAMR